MNNIKKRVLLINPAKIDDFIVARVHMGLTLFQSEFKAKEPLKCPMFSYLDAPHLLEVLYIK